MNDTEYIITDVGLEAMNDKKLNIVFTIMMKLNAIIELIK